MRPAPTPLTDALPGDTVVLLHASASSARQWDALAGTLRPTHEVHALDLHGHGRREAWAGEGPLSLHDDAELALRVLERAGGGHLVGHSYGAAVALYLAARRPPLVRSLALYEPVVFRLLADRVPASAAAREVFAVAARLHELVAGGHPLQAAEVFVDYWSGAGAWLRMGAERQRSVAARLPTTVAHFDTLFNEPLPASGLRQLDMPVLVLHGTQTTPAARLVADLLAELLPSATHEALPGLGHMGPLTDAPRVNERLLRFLRATAMAAAPATADTAA